MKRFIPLGVILFGAVVWLFLLLGQEKPLTVDLAPYAVGQMQAFEVFPEPKDLPGTLFFDREGEQVSFSDLSGKVLLVNVWATWCEPCREEMPTLVNLQERVGGDDFQVITISVDWKGFPVMDEFFNEYKITGLPAYWDNSGLLPGQLEVIGLPLTILVDEDGQWIGRMDGPAEWNSADAIALMKAASKKTN